ncbi:hypothetical protein [Clostridium sp.]
MKTSGKLSLIKDYITHTGNDKYDTYVDKVIGCVGVEYDYFVYDQIEIVLKDFWDKTDNLKDTLVKIESLISSHDGGKYKKKIGMVRYEFDRDKFHEKNRYILILLWVPTIWISLQMLYVNLFKNISTSFKDIAFLIAIVLIFTFLQYIFTYVVKKSMYSSNFFVITNGRCLYNKTHLSDPNAGSDRRIYDLNKILKVESDFKSTCFYGEIQVRDNTDGDIKSRKTISKLKVKNYYKDIEEVIKFVNRDKVESMLT